MAEGAYGLLADLPWKLVMKWKYWELVDLLWERQSDGSPKISCKFDSCVDYFIIIIHICFSDIRCTESWSYLSSA